jgi:hypothetical protein
MIGGADEFGAFLKPLVVVKINACHYSSLCLELPKIKKMLMGFITKTGGVHRIHRNSDGRGERR